MDYTRNDTAATIAESGAVKFILIQPLAPNGTTDDAGVIEAEIAPIAFSAKMATVPTPGKIHARPSTARRGTGTFRSHFGSPLAPVRLP